MRIAIHKKKAMQKLCVVDLLALELLWSRCSPYWLAFFWDRIKYQTQNAILRNAKVGGCAGKKQMKTLFDRSVAHTNDPQTSYDAAEKMVKSGELNKQEQEVYAQIVLYEERIRFLKNYKHKGVTAKELSKWSGLNYWVIQRRLCGIHRKGKIKRTGDIRDGSNAWSLT